MADRRTVTPQHTADLPGFGEFFKAVTGQLPYVWQSKAAEAIEQGSPPSAVTVPTGFGKTSLMLCWVWALARDLDRCTRSPVELRRVPMRYVVVVDRRAVVDDTTAMARRVAALLLDAEASEPVRLVADVLRLPGEELVLEVCQLRGGLPEKPENVRHPAVPAVIVGTVDLVGSRLLWRGYGVNSQRRSIEASLVGADVLFVLDEAHIAAQFLRTLRLLDVQQAEEGWFAGTVPGRFVVEMSATPRAGSIAFDWALEASARADVGERRERRRATRVEIVRAEARTSDAALLWFLRRVNPRPGEPLLVFANTPATAKKASDVLAKRPALAAASIRPPVLIGGMPEHFRASPRLAEVVDSFRTGLRASGSHEGISLPGSTAVALCATQTLEVGADLDADHLISSVAAPAALIQRLGRVNRVGARDGCTVTIVVGDGEPEPVYGAGAADLGAALLAANPGTLGDLEELLTGAEAGRWRDPERSLAVLPRHIFEAYTRTAGSLFEPEVGRWLRPPADPRAEVVVTFRASMTAINDEPPLIDHLTRCPPGPGESWTVPISLAGELLDAARRQHAGAFLLDPTRTQPVNPNPEKADLRPGWILVFGQQLDAFGIPGAGTDLVLDLPASERPFAIVWREDHVSVEGDDVESGTSDDDDLAGWMSPDVLAARAGDMDAAIRSVRREGDQVDLAPAFSVTALLDGDGRATSWLEILRLRGVDEPVPDQVVLLSEHQAAVAHRVRSWAIRLGLPEGIVHDVTLAAAHHDDGKLADIVQSELRTYLDAQGALQMLGGDAVAKSMLPRRWWPRARRLAGIPIGYRHEAGSADRFDVLLADAAIDPVDADLVRHLILTHHGWWRGPGPTLTDPRVATPAYQDPGAPEWAQGPDQFASLNRRYGPYTLALAETLVRLADWRESRTVSCSCSLQEEVREP